MKNLIQYKTIKQETHHEIPKIKNSKFIGHVHHVESKEQAMSIIAEYKKKYYDATHNCRAYRVNPQLHYDLFGHRHIDPLDTRKSDDGEPSGTAAGPIMKAIETAELQNVLVIVTRYYGGTNLGIGGLVQAYGECAKAVIDSAHIENIQIQEKLTLDFDNNLVSKVMKMINDNRATIIDQVNYDNKTQINLMMNTGLTEKFVKDCKESGGVTVKVI